MELTSGIRKLVSKLADAKTRRESGLFVAEGAKCVADTIDSFECRYLFANAQWATDNPDFARTHNCCIVKNDDLRRMSSLSTQPPVIAVYVIPKSRDVGVDAVRNRLVIALDRVQDPGNLGTIVRIADWFGITDIICSLDTVDIYNPKTVQATMGAISRVNVSYVNLAEFLSSAAKSGTPIYGTFLDGESIYTSPLAQNGIIIMGNEGKGISAEVEANVSQRLLIPHFSSDGSAPSSDSLNVAMATAIVVAEFRRRFIKGLS
ncbi:MAG: RNA methyltransferase [Muribaculaceae bacterium]|nr:RNA methyltransferase [Muribaculaceae bacterium]MBQ7212455.1 RNA methyltransferase [Muribaculaceae bacterium]